MRKRPDGQMVFTRTEMVGRYDQFGCQVVRFVRQARDSKGSDGMVYEMRRPDGTLQLEFVHIRNHVPWWYRASLQDPTPTIDMKTFETVVSEFYAQFTECLGHNEVFR